MSPAGPTALLLALGAALLADGRSADWAGLEHEVERLARTLARGEDSGPRPTVQFQSVFRAGGGARFADELGFEIEQLKFGFVGQVGRFEYKLRTQNKRGPSELSTTYVRTQVAPGARLSVGYEKVALLWSSLVSRSRVLFNERSRQGGIWNGRDFGLRLFGEVGPARGYVAVQNGGDGVGRDLLLSGRLEATLLGQGPLLREGSPGSGAPLQLLLGAGLADEGSLDDGRVVALDAACVAGPVFAQVEWLDYGRDFTAGSVVAGGARKAAGSAGTRPVDATLAWRWSPRWEAAGRFEWLGDADGTWAVLVGLNRHLSARRLKVQMDALHQESGDATRRGDRLTLGIFWNL